MHPAQAMLPHVELSGIIADDHGRGKEAVRLDAPPKRAFGGDAHRVGRDVERGNAQVVEMRLPGRVIGKACLALVGETRHARSSAGSSLISRIIANTLS